MASPGSTIGGVTRNAKHHRLERIAVGVDGYPEGRDAAVLAAMIARATGSEVVLVAVHPDPLVVVPAEMGWTAMHEEAKGMLRELRDSLVAGARIDVETDWSVARALERVVRREHRDLLVVGSSRRAPEGRLRIGNRTRQLLGDVRCALAVAPRGFRHLERPELRVVGVGYDGEPEGREAVEWAAALALAAGAKLRVDAVLDDRMPLVAWSPADADVQAMWDAAIRPEVDALRGETRCLAAVTGADVEVNVSRGSPPEALIELSENVDLLVIGSRRWGADQRVLLGSTGEILMNEARCPVMVVPRPPAK